MQAVINIDGQLKFDQVSEPVCTPELSAKVKIINCGICGSDIRAARIKLPRARILGHEIAGNLVSVYGEEVPRLGQRLVTVFPIIPCHRCRFCEKKIYRDCVQKKSIGFDLNGGWSEFIVIPRWNLHFITTSMSTEEVALIEPVACAIRLHKEMLNAGVNASSSVLIIGDGAMAAIISLTLGINGLDDVMRVSIRPERDRYFYSKHVRIKPDSLDKDGQKFDYIIVCSPEQNLQSLSVAASRKSTQIFPVSRLVPAVQKDVDARHIALGRAFAYMREDFFSAENIISRHNCYKNILGAHQLLLSEIPKFIGSRGPFRGVKTMVKI